MNTPTEVPKELLLVSCEVCGLLHRPLHALELNPVCHPCRPSGQGEAMASSTPKRRRSPARGWPGRTRRVAPDLRWSRLVKRVEELAQEARGEFAQRLSLVLPIVTNREVAKVDRRIANLGRRIRALEGRHGR